MLWKPDRVGEMKLLGGSNFVPVDAETTPSMDTSGVSYNTTQVFSSSTYCSALAGKAGICNHHFGVAGSEGRKESLPLR